jgi:hypothetical protein
MNKLDTIAEAADAAAVWTPSPEQAKWLGGANQQDPYILSRMSDPKPPITWFTDPADQALAKRLGFPAAPAAPAASTQPATAATAAATSDKVNGDAVNKLNDLAFKLSQLKGVTGSTQPGVTKPPATKPPATTPPATKAPATKAPGTYTKVAADTDYSGTGGNAMEESYNSDIANALMESFGYTKLDEAPAWMQNLKTAAGNAKTGATTAGTNVVNTIKANPKKSAAALAAAGLAGYGLNKALSGDPSTTGGNTGGNKKAPTGSTQPAAGGTATPEQQAIIDEMMKIMASLEGVEDPQTLAALANAQQQISTVTASKAQAAQDTATAGAARDAADAAPAPSAPAGNQPDANQSSAETNRLAAQNKAAAPAAPAATPAANGVNAAGQNVTMPNGINPETGKPTASVQPVKEDELARWLKIARG